MHQLRPLGPASNFDDEVSGAHFGLSVFPSLGADQFPMSFWWFRYPSPRRRLYRLSHAQSRYLHTNASRCLRNRSFRTKV